MTNSDVANQRLIWAFLRVNPHSPRIVVKGKLVHADQKMSTEEFDESLATLLKEGHVYKHHKDRFKTTSRYPPIKFGKFGELEPKRKAVRLKFPKQRIHKAKAVIIKRKYIEGYKCRRCGAFFDRSWEKTRIRKCRNCGVKTYYGKPTLLKSVRLVQKITRKGKQLRKIAELSAWKIKFPTLEDLKIRPDQVVNSFDEKFDAQKDLDKLRAAGDDKPYRIVQAYDSTLRKTPWYLVYDPTLPKVALPQPVRRGRPRVHLPREEYKGSEKAKTAARKAWETRRRVTVGFYKDKEKRTHPITKTLGELNRKQIIKKPKKFKGVKPKSKKR